MCFYRILLELLQTKDSDVEEIEENDEENEEIMNELQKETKEHITISIKSNSLWCTRNRQNLFHDGISLLYL